MKLQFQIKMFSIIRFLFSQSQFFNFILLESESKGFKGSIIQEVSTGGSNHMVMILQSWVVFCLMKYLCIHFQESDSDFGMQYPIYFDDCKERCSLRLLNIKNDPYLAILFEWYEKSLFFRNLESQITTDSHSLISITKI